AYRTAMAAAPSMGHVGTVTLHPLDLPAVRTYLSEGDAGPVWAPFFAAVGEGRAEIAMALCTPLGATLADEAYRGRPDRDPRELLSVTPPTAEAVVDKLVDFTIDGAFDPFADRRFNLDRPRRRRWKRTTQAWQWLSFLASNMDAARVPNIRLWTLEAA